MADLIKTLQLALEEVATIGNQKAIDIIERAIVQARRINKPRRCLCSLYSLKGPMRLRRGPIWSLLFSLC